MKSEHNLASNSMKALYDDGEECEEQVEYCLDADE